MLCCVLSARLGRIDLNMFIIMKTFPQISVNSIRSYIFYKILFRNKRGDFLNEPTIGTISAFKRMCCEPGKASTLLLMYINKQSLTLKEVTHGDTSAVLMQMHC